MAKLASVMLLLMLCGCALRHTETYGYSFQGRDLSGIKIGSTSRAEISELIGSPTSISQFGPTTWYYIYRKQERFAFLNPRLVEQQVLAITFDEKEVVSGIERYSHADAVKLKFDKDSTEPVVDRIGVIEQIVSNVGKFKRPASKAY